MLSWEGKSEPTSMPSKKPDNVVYDEKTQKYNASILPYATNVSGPVIKLDDVGVFKERGVNRVQKTFNVKYKELVDEYNHLIDEVELNNMIYNSKYSFEPVIGEIYHLYVGNDENYFLSLIAPHEWNKPHITSVRLNSEHKWVSTNDL
jgi:hypothetical protein